MKWIWLIMLGLVSLNGCMVMHATTGKEHDAMPPIMGNDHHHMHEEGEE